MADVRKLSDRAVLDLEKDIQNRYTDLQNSVKTLHQILDTMERNWTGVGAGAFDAKQQEINLSIRGIGETLVTTLDRLQTMRGDKESLEDEIKAQINRIQTDTGAGRSAFDGM
ncbi:WXG100 family type VII secretion target [Streptomyces sp. NPDC050418]|uniref:WXG100 family type VII secretion target n=1 Tax=Streptomyces sp. NPDC050418 TaxID=3365612 RepID=UPI0037B89F45